MDIQKIKELALANGFKLKEQASGNMDLNAYVYDFANAIEQAAKAQAVPEIQQSKQAEIDDLKAQLKAVHESRIEFVEYCRMIESGNFVIVDKKDTEVWWQDSEEPENFATKEDDLSFIAQHIEDDEVMEINEHHTVHLPSVTKFGAWVYQNGQRKFFVGTKDEVEAARGRK